MITWNICFHKRRATAEKDYQMIPIVTRMCQKRINVTLAYVSLIASQQIAASEG